MTIDAQEQIEAFASAWYSAWNARDLEQILSHYDSDVEFSSPFATRLAPDSGGTLHGIDQLADYFRAALERFPELRFEPIGLFTGVGSAVLHYRSVEGLIAAETMVFGGDMRVVRVLAHYAPG